MDKNKFWWDIGGHVLFSHYKYYDDVVNRILGENFLEHLRESWIWVMNRFVPYPFQNNIHRLPKGKMEECLKGLNAGGKKSENFEEWIYSTFGKGIAKYFMVPYNEKVWAHPLEKMSKDWIAERVSVVDIGRVKQNIAEKKDDVSWGPNNKFIFPLYGGTGSLFSGIAGLFGDKIHFNKDVSEVDAGKRKIVFADGSMTEYDCLITTMPLDKFVKKASLKGLYKYLKNLVHSSGLIVGIGINKKCPSNKCWVYFPEKNSPFYRVTYFSNYSPNNAPAGHFSLMSETSCSKTKRENKSGIIEKTIQGMINSRLISKNDAKKIVSKYLIDVEYSYPVPTLGRDKALMAIQKCLMAKGIYSRGRFGAWKYEIGNMDHSFMQGVEAVNNILLGEKEKTWSL